MDLGKTQRDYAVYLPAISSFYTKQLEKVERVTESRVPAGFEKGHEGLDFLRPDAYFYYPNGLYSAGHAQLDLDKTDKDEPMIQHRDRNTSMILGDSGVSRLQLVFLKWIGKMPRTQTIQPELQFVIKFSSG